MFTRTAARSALSRIPRARGLRFAAAETGLFLWIAYPVAEGEALGAQDQALLEAAKVVAPDASIGDSGQSNPRNLAIGPFPDTATAMTAARAMNAIVPLESVVIELHEANHISLVLPSGMFPDEMLDALKPASEAVDAATLTLLHDDSDLLVHHETPPSEEGT